MQKKKNLNLIFLKVKFPLIILSIFSGRFLYEYDKQFSSCGSNQL